MQGNLFTSDHLSRIKSGDVPGLNPKDYSTTGRLDERISRDWSALANAWGTFQLKRKTFPEDDFVNTRDYWLESVFHELGYGRLVKKPGPIIQEKQYPIEYRWENVPIHIVGSRQELEETSDETPSRPHSLLQEYLNRAPDAKWGIVTNGVRWRVLRQNSGSRKPSYVEFNLEAMFEGEHFDEFGIFWRFCHPSRFEGTDPWIEKWMRESARQGIRALATLRRGVEDAIITLGRGFLKHRNPELAKRVDSGQLSATEFYHQVLRLVYRLLFLAVTEDRDLLLVPENPANLRVRRAYYDYYSFRRMRELSRRHKGSRHTDLYESLKLVMRGLKSASGEPALALPALNSALWSEDFIPDLERATIENRDLLAAVRRLSYVEVGGQFQAIDYVNLGAEELGSVYESLLELRPTLNVAAHVFDLASTPASERKASGSYYTPTSIIDEGLETSLAKLLLRCRGAPNPERAILSLKVCDPTCGSGHFLVAAGHRIAFALAQVRTGDIEPTPTARRQAFRDVVSRCLYGVDLNPMAVELCKVSLWLEAMEPGKPLAFLEHKIQCGNAVIGATPKMLKAKIPDGAYEALEGDEKQIAREARENNRKHTQKQVSLHGFKGIIDEEFQSEIKNDIDFLNSLRDDSVLTVHEKERLHEQHLRRLQFAKDYADFWCAAFFQVKVANSPELITQETLNQLLEDPNLVSEEQWSQLKALREEYGFFHWHLAFPDVLGLPQAGSADHWSGGFDLILGNPPWDTLSPDTREFFSQWDSEIGNKDKDAQDAAISKALSNVEIARAWSEHRRRLFAAVNFYKQSGRFRLFAPGSLGKGDFNIFRMITEHGLDATAPAGFYSQVLPENFYRGANCMAIRERMFRDFAVSHLYAFVNTNEVWFPSVTSRFRFCLITALKEPTTTAFRASFAIDSEESLLNARSTALEIPVELVRELSPDALQIPELSNQNEVSICRKMYARCPKFGSQSSFYDESPYMAELHLGNDRGILERSGDIPVYEGKMLTLFDHRARIYEGGQGRASQWIEVGFDESSKAIKPQWWIRRTRVPAKLGQRIHAFRVGFCDVARSDDHRTLATSVIPPETICGHSVPTIKLKKPWMEALFVGVANSISLDWLARSRVSLHLTYTIMDSLPFPNLDENHPVAREIVRRTANLICVGPEMEPFWDSLAADAFVTGAPPNLVARKDRVIAQCELSALVATKVFELERDELRYQLESFEVLRRRDEKEFGFFATRDWTLAAFDSGFNDLPTPSTAELWGGQGRARGRPRTLAEFSE